MGLEAARLVPRLAQPAFLPLDLLWLGGQMSVFVHLVDHGCGRQDSGRSRIARVGRQDVVEFDSEPRMWLHQRAGWGHAKREAPCS